MKVFIQYPFQQKAWGGGNQFIKTLHKEFKSLGVACSNPADADVILFNSHQQVRETIQLKQSFPTKRFIHRVDGPMRLYNHKNDWRDLDVYSANQKIANATVFQSRFSFESNRDMGMLINKPHTIIGNASDPSIFFEPEIKTERNKLRIVSTSFSSNKKKGFSTYKFLDENLDFDKFEYTFVGNSPVTFKNIKSVGVKTSVELADILRSSDIYITASQNDPCSNSLIEAVTCGLTCFALDSGGHPEIVTDPRLLFRDNITILNSLNGYSLQSYNTVKPRINKVATDYLEFMKHDRNA